MVSFLARLTFPACLLLTIGALHFHQVAQAFNRIYHFENRFVAPIPGPVALTRAVQKAGGVAACPQAIPGLAWVAPNSPRSQLASKAPSKNGIPLE